MEAQGIENKEIRDLITEYLEENEQGMRELMTWFLNQVMDHEAEQQSGAGRYVRGKGRRAHRNGHRERTLSTRHGLLQLSKPQLREFPFRTKVFETYSRVENALTSVIMESYIQGVATRDVRTVVEGLGVENISPSTVSRMAKELDVAVHQFLDRPIDDEIAFLIVDASYFKVRDGARYVSKALFVVAGIRADGCREILGAKIADGEDGLLWEGYFDELKARGLHGVKVVISDGHKGIIQAVQHSFTGAAWQLCQVHFMRNLLKTMAKKYWPEVSYEMKAAMNSPESVPAFRERLLSLGLEKSVDMLDRYHDSLFNYTAFPRQYWRRLRTTNMLERINLELKRRTRKVGAFTGEQSLLRLTVSILMDINEEWLTGRKYLSLEES